MPSTSKLIKAVLAGVLLSVVRLGGNASSIAWHTIRRMKLLARIAALTLTALLSLAQIETSSVGGVIPDTTTTLPASVRADFPDGIAPDGTAIVEIVLESNREYWPGLIFFSARCAGPPGSYVTFAPGKDGVQSASHGDILIEGFADASTVNESETITWTMWQYIELGTHAYQVYWSASVDSVRCYSAELILVGHAADGGAGASAGWGPAIENPPLVADPGPSPYGGGSSFGPSRFVNGRSLLDAEANCSAQSNGPGDVVVGFGPVTGGTEGDLESPPAAAFGLTDGLRDVLQDDWEIVQWYGLTDGPNGSNGHGIFKRYRTSTGNVECRLYRHLYAEFPADHAWSSGFASPSLEPVNEAPSAIPGSQLSFSQPSSTELIVLISALCQNTFAGAVDVAVDVYLDGDDVTGGRVLDTLVANDTESFGWAMHIPTGTSGLHQVSAGWRASATGAVACAAAEVIVLAVCQDADNDCVADDQEISKDCLNEFFPDSTHDPDNETLPTYVELFETFTDPCDSDTDDDSCTDGEEVSGNQALGGQRDPLYFWDFYDVDGTKSVGLSDTLLILMHFGHAANGDALDNLLDRYIPNVAQGWRSAEANNGVGLVDALANLRSFGDSCVAPP